MEIKLETKLCVIKAELRKSSSRNSIPMSPEKLYEVAVSIYDYFRRMKPYETVRVSMDKVVDMIDTSFNMMDFYHRLNTHLNTAYSYAEFINEEGYKQSNREYISELENICKKQANEIFELNKKLSELDNTHIPF